MIALLNTPTHYGLIAKLLHWTSVALVLATVVIATQAAALDAGPAKGAALTNHALLGLLILAVMLARLFWRTGSLNPVNSYALPRWYKVAAMSLHRGLYCVVFALVLTGILQVVCLGESLDVAGRLGIESLVTEKPSLGELWHDTHVRFTYVLYAAITAHVLGAIVHQIVSND